MGSRRWAVQGVHNKVHIGIGSKDQAIAQGTEINVLYYDELMVGTGTGLYTHTGTTVVTNTESIEIYRDRIAVFPNPIDDQFTILLDVLFCTK